MLNDPVSSAISKTVARIEATLHLLFCLAIYALARDGIQLLPLD